jgi:activator of HSP90 ATPase
MIEQTIEFPNVTAAQLFETYLDSTKHAAAIGATAVIQPRVGGTFRAFNGVVVGTILHLVPNQMIVQTWRSLERWRPHEPDSVLVLSFDDADGVGRLRVAHSGVPDRDVKMFDEGWYIRYWWPWAEHFAERAGSAPDARSPRSKRPREPGN